MKIVIKKARPNEPALYGGTPKQYPYLIQILGVPENKLIKVQEITGLDTFNKIPSVCFNNLVSATQEAHIIAKSLKKL